MRTVILLCVLLSTLGAEGELITVPPSLQPGDQYRLAFLTPLEIATGKTIAEYNSFVQSQADAVAEVSLLGAKWAAVASTDEIDIARNTGTDPDIHPGVPIYLLNGRRVAANNSDLWDGALEGHIRVYPNSEFEPFAVEVMARRIGPDRSNIGNQIDVGSIPTNFCSMGYCLSGETHPPQQATSSDWITAYDQPRGSFKMYAISSILTVVPEPWSELNFAIGALAVLPLMRRSRIVQRATYSHS